jgi:hypothetical protein
MRAGRLKRIMPAMQRPIPLSKVLLVTDRRTPAAAPGSIQVRRYRLARLRFDPRPDADASRFTHLKRVYD